MAIASPSENVYYYECTNGRFRLTYFIPSEELKRLSDDGRISPSVIEDFPDGMDVGCTKSDFKELEDDYGYRPPHDPDALRRAFYAIFSTTHNWKKFRGSGFIPAADLERHLETVDKALLKEKIKPEDIEPLPDVPNLKERRQRKHRQDAQQTQADKVLRKLSVEGIDPERSLTEQQFSRVNWAKGLRAEEVFFRLHQKQRKGE